MTRACSITKHTILQLKPNKVKFPPSGGGENPIVTALKKICKTCFNTKKQFENLRFRGNNSSYPAEA